MSRLTYIPIHVDGRLNDGKDVGTVIRISPVSNAPGDYYIFSGMGDFQYDNYTTGIDGVVIFLEHRQWSQVEWHGLAADNETIPRETERALQAVIFDIENLVDTLRDHDDETVRAYLEGYSRGAMCALGVDQGFFNRGLMQCVSEPISDFPRSLDLPSAQKWTWIHCDAWNLVLADFYAKHKKFDI